MASIITRAKAYLRSPQGQRHKERAIAAARDPRNQAKAKQVLARFKSSGTRRHPR
ncbi:hypothetical protein [Actinomadura parmotrematis]|uniref:Uncharacterized protein n=1 Tax=Actinomadura parmotrematis TaxID=2864039 RepID=A0ABS7FRM1_9ACTN|nr:hypothetical protein [Actinomadura parmotrematis]MBW8483051.1 hypothetical protein [Actinomadura parmotrematis]